MRFEIFDTFSKSFQIPNVMKIRPMTAELLHAGGRTDGKTEKTKLIVAFRNFANATKIIGDLREGKLQKAEGN